MTAEWYREQALILAQNTYTPVGYYLEMPFRQLKKMIATYNRIQKEAEKK